MNCANCGTLRDSGSRFCAVCGVSFETATNISSRDAKGSTESKSSPSRGKRWIIIVAALAGVTFLVALFVPRPVTIELAIVDVNGGTFDSSCNLTNEGLGKIGKYITANNVGTGAVSKGELDFRLSADGSCKGFASVVIDPFSTFEIKSKQTVTTLEGFRFFPTKFEAVQAVEISHKISVRLDFSIEHDYCTGTMESWTCYGGDSLGTKGNTCFGRWGYSDIGKGASVVIAGRSNGLTSQGALKAGDDWNLDSISSAIITCELKANPIEVPHDDAGYDVTISDRGDVKFSIADLRDSRWLAVLTLGD